MLKNIHTREIKISLTEGAIYADLFMPPKAKGLVIFSHGSGSSRKSPRNRFVAEELLKHSFASLLADLLTEKEDTVYANRFDINLLTRRLIDLTTRARNMEELKELPLGYFGASTGAASAIRAAAHEENVIEAVVSRGGRPDLAGEDILKLQCPTLLIVGSLDYPVIELNHAAYSQMKCKREMMLINGATHLFEEAGALEKVAEVASDWFDKYLID
jgi:alpha-beta hydrolase superfamily lysophospholipase